MTVLLPLLVVGSIVSCTSQDRTSEAGRPDSGAAPTSTAGGDDGSTCGAGERLLAAGQLDEAAAQFRADLQEAASYDCALAGLSGVAREWGRRAQQLQDQGATEQAALARLRAIETPSGDLARPPASGALASEPTDAIRALVAAERYDAASVALDELVAASPSASYPPAWNALPDRPRTGRFLGLERLEREIDGFVDDVSPLEAPLSLVALAALLVWATWPWIRRWILRRPATILVLPFTDSQDSRAVATLSADVIREMRRLRDDGIGIGSPQIMTSHVTEAKLPDDVLSLLPQTTPIKALVSLVARPRQRAKSDMALVGEARSDADGALTSLTVRLTRPIRRSRELCRIELDASHALLTPARARLGTGPRAAVGGAPPSPDAAATPFTAEQLARLPRVVALWVWYAKDPTGATVLGTGHWLSAARASFGAQLQEAAARQADSPLRRLADAEYDSALVLDPANRGALLNRATQQLVTEGPQLAQAVQQLRALRMADATGEGDRALPRLALPSSLQARLDRAPEEAGASAWWYDRAALRAAYNVAAHRLNTTDRHGRLLPAGSIDPREDPAERDVITFIRAVIETCAHLERRRERFRRNDPHVEALRTVVRGLEPMALTMIIGLSRCPADLGPASRAPRYRRHAMLRVLRTTAATPATDTVAGLRDELLNSDVGSGVRPPELLATLRRALDGPVKPSKRGWGAVMADSAVRAQTHYNLACALARVSAAHSSSRRLTASAPGDTGGEGSWAVELTQLARQELERAVNLRVRLRIRAASDPWLASLRSDQRATGRGARL